MCLKGIFSQNQKTSRHLSTAWVYFQDRNAYRVEDQFIIIIIFFNKLEFKMTNVAGTWLCAVLAQISSTTDSVL